MRFRVTEESRGKSRPETSLRSTEGGKWGTDGIWQFRAGFEAERGCKDEPKELEPDTARG